MEFWEATKKFKDNGYSVFPKPTLAFSNLKTRASFKLYRFATRGLRATSGEQSNQITPGRWVSKIQ